MVDKEKDIKGKVIKYVAKVAYCEECESEIFVSEIRDFNLKELDIAYRKVEDLIIIEDIEKILERYDIGKRPLSLLLGWGEGTLTRYVDGDTPSKPYSDMLKRILEDKIYYLEILEQNKDSITSVAYRKSMVAAEEIAATTVNEISKLESAVRYLLMQTLEITPLALQKLLYFAQGFQKAFRNNFLFEEDCEAWVHGPVYRNVYEKYRSYGYNPIEENELSFENINLSDDEKELLDYIVLYFGCYSGKVLEKMTHSEESWRVARRGFMDWEISDMIIEKNEIDSYFSSVKDKYKMLNLTDIKDYSKDLFSKLYS
jgi:uncharacterized phage-associated protein